MECGDEIIRQQAVCCGESFAVANQLVVEFAVPIDAAFRKCEVTWPGGQTQGFVIPSDLRTVVLMEGQSRVFSLSVSPHSTNPAITESDAVKE